MEEEEVVLMMESIIKIEDTELTPEEWETTDDHQAEDTGTFAATLQNTYYEQEILPPLAIFIEYSEEFEHLFCLEEQGRNTESEQNCLMDNKEAALEKHDGMTEAQRENNTGLSRLENNEKEFQTEKYKEGTTKKETAKIGEDKDRSATGSSPVTRAAVFLEEKKFICNECGRTFCTPGSLKLHTHSHARQKSGEIIFKRKEFLCEICNRSLTTKEGLARHARLHSGEKPFQCNTCNKQFTQKISLVQHERTHTGERPYKCEVCDKGFMQHGHLSEHRRVHSGEKPFVCNQCGRLFARSGQFYQHLRMHFGIKPHKCEVCSRCFTRSRDLARHKRLHAEDDNVYYVRKDSHENNAQQSYVFTKPG